MFVIKEPDSISWPVKVNVPTDDGEGGTEEGEFLMRFKYLPVPELNAVLSKLAVATDAATVKEYVIGWDGLATADGTLVFSQENLDRIMTISYMLVGINKAFIDCQMGRATKN